MAKENTHMEKEQEIIKAGKELSFEDYSDYLKKFKKEPSLEDLKKKNKEREVMIQDLIKTQAEQTQKRQTMPVNELANSLEILPKKDRMKK